MFDFLIKGSVKRTIKKPLTKGEYNSLSKDSKIALSKSIKGKKKRKVKNPLTKKEYNSLSKASKNRLKKLL